MKSEKIELFALMFILGQAFLFSVIFNSSINLLNQDAYLIPLIGGLIELLLIFVYTYIFKENENVLKLNQKLFKNGFIINMIFLILISLLTSDLFWILINFISSQFLYKTPYFMISIIFILTIIYVVKTNSKTLLRFILITFYILGILFITINTGLIRQIDISNIMPFFTFKAHNLFIGTFNYIAFTAPLFFTILIIPKNKTNWSRKNIIIYYLIITLISTFITFIVISIFGINLSKLYQYPLYHILKRVFIGASLERLENILCAYWFLIMVVSIIYLCFFISKTLEQTKINNYLYIFLILFLSKFLFSNIVDAQIFNEMILPIILNATFTILPITIALKIRGSK